MLTHVNLNGCCTIIYEYNMVLYILISTIKIVPINRSQITIDGNVASVL